MSDPKQQPAQEELSPEARAIISRARRSFGFTLGVMVLGLIALSGAVVYRVSQSSSPAQPAGDYVIAALAVPEGAEIVAAVAADGTVTLTYRIGAMTSVRIFDGKTGALLREIPIVPE